MARSDNKVARIKPIKPKQQPKPRTVPVASRVRDLEDRRGA